MNQALKQEKKEAKRALGSIPGAGQVVRVAKDAGKRKLRVVMFPEGGGEPYELDVEVDDKGHFDVGESTFMVERGSVWQGRDGLFRAIAKEDQPRTINAAIISGDAIMHPKVFHSATHQNILSQFSAMARAKGLWKQAGTYGLIAAIVVLVLVQIWLVQTLGGGMESLGDALNGLELQTTPAPDPGSQAAAGHQPIAPGSE